MNVLSRSVVSVENNKKSIGFGELLRLLDFFDFFAPVKLFCRCTDKQNVNMIHL